MKKILFLLMIFLISCGSKDTAFQKKVFSDRERGITFSFAEKISEDMKVSMSFKNTQNKNLFFTTGYRPVLNVNLENTFFVDSFAGKLEFQYPDQSWITLYELNRFGKPTKIVTFQINYLYREGGNFEVFFHQNKKEKALKLCKE